MHLLNFAQFYSGHIGRLRTVTGLLSPYPRHMHIHPNMQTEITASSLHVHDPSNFHPLFSNPDGDVILGAKGGNVLFRTHSFTLKTTSGWFRTMFSLPQKCAPTTADVIYMDEDPAILESLLRMACGLPIIPPTNYDTVDALLYGAEKYDMPGPISIIRMLVMTPLLLNQPLRLYAVACRFGWEEEAKYASMETLTLNLHSEACRPSLQALSTTALLDLLALHRDRREALRARLDEAPFVGGGTAVCVACGWSICYRSFPHAIREQFGKNSSLIAHLDTWRELKYKIILEMDVRPLGDTVVNSGLTEWHEAKRCWSAKVCSLFHSG